MSDSTDLLLQKIQGCLYGGAIGDAMGGVAEWRTPHEIRQRYGYITDLVEAWDAPDDQSGRGDGRYTMTATWCSCSAAATSSMATTWTPTSIFAASAP